MNEEQADTIQKSIEALLRDVKSLSLATVDAQGRPQISYTPFLRHEDAIYVLVSELAPHTQNLRNTPTAEIMLIEDETGCQNIFARKRLILQCHSTFIDRNNVDREERLQALETRLGSTVLVLKELTDFWLVRLSPERGRYVQGFAQAFAFERMDFASAHLLEGR